MHRTNAHLIPMMRASFWHRLAAVWLLTLMLGLADGRLRGQTPSGSVAATADDRAAFADEDPWAQPLQQLRLDAVPRFQDRLERHVRAAAPGVDQVETRQLPAGFQAWWEPEVIRPQQAHRAVQAIELDTLLISALHFSPQVHAIRETGFIRSTAIVEAETEFDTTAFMESKFIRASDPVGDELTTGGPSRFRDSNWYYSAGTRRLTRGGGTIEVTQRLGYRDNNSLFLDPTQQGTARLSLSFTQPLLNGAGRTYNQGRIVLAQLDAQAAADEVLIGLQQHLVEVTQAYWDLYLRRAVFRQKQRHHHRGREILQRLADRRDLDALQSQILAATAAVAVRQADLDRAVMGIRNAESRIRTLVSDPTLYQPEHHELIPATVVSRHFVPISLRDAAATALYSRPDVDAGMQQARMASLRLNMSTKELLPMLNLVLETYVAGLEGQSRVGRAWQNQFTQGEPGYTAGLLFEVPLHNRAARSRRARHRSELRQVSSELLAIVDNTMLEVEIALRAVYSAHRDIVAHYRSMDATRAEVEYLEDRWKFLPGDDRYVSLMLEDLLRAQDRLAEAEFRFAESQVAYAMAQVNLKQAMGILLTGEQLKPGQPAIPAVPENLFEQRAPAEADSAPPGEQAPRQGETIPLPITRLPAVPVSGAADRLPSGRRLPPVR